MKDQRQNMTFKSDINSSNFMLPSSPPPKPVCTCFAGGDAVQRGARSGFRFGKKKLEA